MTFSRLALCLLVASVGACGKKSNGVVSTKGSGDQNNDSEDASVAPVKMTTTTKDAGATVAVSSPNAPIVKILEPAAASDPNKDTVLTDPMLVARCQVTRSKTSAAHDVNQSAVRMRVTWADPKQQITGVVSADGANMFKAEFNLSMLPPNGPLELRCEADDTAEKPLTGFAVVDTLLDLGPTITIQEPLDKSSHSLMSPVLVKFQVDPDPLDDSDKEAKPVEIALDVSGQKFDVTEDPSQAGLYTTSINFNDKTLFPMAPTSAEVTVTAKSSRTPNAPARVVRSQIMLDADGPKIVVLEPMNNAIVRGDVVLKVMITDPSGVKQDTVVAKINQDLHTLDHWTIADNMYSEQFDTRPFGTELVELTINIKAADQVGNESTQSLMLKLDNKPPILSLNPPWVREWRGPSDKVECSDAFDPLGDAADDLSTQPDSSLYRVMVFEEGNSSPGQPLTYVAGVQSGSVILFLRKPDAPLLIDTNGDGDCDEINIKPDGVDPPTQVALSPLQVRGSAYYSMDSLNAGKDKNVADAFCGVGADTKPPTALCPAATRMPRAMAQPMEGPATPAIYALSPTNSDLGECEGKTWQLIQMKAIGEGWVCLAARAEDTIGNVGVSPPLRVCLDDLNGTALCDAVHDTPPTCTDGCKIVEPFPSNVTYKAH